MTFLAYSSDLLLWPHWQWYRTAELITSKNKKFSWWIKKKLFFFSDHFSFQKTSPLACCFETSFYISNEKGKANIALHEKWTWYIGFLVLITTAAVSLDFRDAKVLICLCQHLLSSWQDEASHKKSWLQEPQVVFTPSRQCFTDYWSEWIKESLSIKWSMNNLKTAKINAEGRILSVILSFVANSDIKVQILTLDEGKYAFNVLRFDFRQAYKRTNRCLC